VVGTRAGCSTTSTVGNLDLSNVTQLVLDEADEMLDMGFLPDVERLVEACQGEDRHTMLFSATMPTPIVKLARRYMDHPTFTRADHEESRRPLPNVTQHFFQVHRMDKPRLLARILQDEDRGGVYVFVRTKHMADRLVNELEELDTPAIAIHGDLRQSQREKNLDRFRAPARPRCWSPPRSPPGASTCRRHPRRQLRLPRRREDVPAPHRPDRPRRRVGQGDHLRGVQRGRPPQRDPQEGRATDSELVLPVFSTSPRELRTSNERRTVTAFTRPAARQRRRGSTDGRPKGGREREGRGRDRDADRDRRREPRAGSTEQARRTEPSSDTDPSATRTRTRTRTRRPSPDEAAATTTATRTTTAEEPAAPEGEETAPQEPTSGSGRTRARGRGRGRGADASADSSADRSRDRGGAGPRSGDDDEVERSEGGDRRRDTATRSAKGRGGRGTGGGRAAAKGSRGGGAARDGAGGRRSAQETTPGVTATRRGEEARGQGQPQRARRVRVEHLP
jgi:hypothetical protein